ncbi:MAG: hypothetical protein CK532_07255 [Flavobacteriales bacterium]|nr:MAG: hypothetical protein CK532_07255 [Flavobacteriales bacterium]
MTKPTKIKIFTIVFSCQFLNRIINFFKERQSKTSIFQFCFGALRQEFVILKIKLKLLKFVGWNVKLQK